MRLSCILFLLFVQPKSASAQIALEKKYIEQAGNATTEAAKLKALGALAEFYTVYHADAKADSVLSQQLKLAEASENQGYMVQTFFHGGFANLTPLTGKATFDKALAFADKGLVYAKSIGRVDLEVSAYLTRAALLRKQNKPDEAMHECLYAFQRANAMKNDSLQAELHLQTGEIQMHKGKPTEAYSSYNRAYDIAYRIGNAAIQSAVLHCYANLYQSVGNTELGKASLKASIEINKKVGNNIGLTLDYITLFRLTSSKIYLDKAYALARTTGCERHLIFCKQLLFNYMVIVEKDKSGALAYLSDNEDLIQFFSYQGFPNYNVGTVYQYTGSPDSAIYFYKLDEPLIAGGYSALVQTAFYAELAACYDSLANTTEAINYYKKAYALSKGTGTAMAANQEITNRLAELYAARKLYDTAFQYASLSKKYTADVAQMTEQRGLVLQELEREKNIHEKDVADAELAISRRVNLQYFSIAIAIASVFVLMMFLGMFPTSRAMLRMLGFFSFICLFEFVLILIDAGLHHWVEHQPLRLWLAKIVIIAMLVPIHHFLEHALVNFLTSERLQLLRKNLLSTRWWGGKKHSPPAVPEVAENPAHQPTR